VGFLERETKLLTFEEQSSLVNRFPEFDARSCHTSLSLASLSSKRTAQLWLFEIIMRQFGKAFN
jgi:hypothetical protein